MGVADFYILMTRQKTKKSFVCWLNWFDLYGDVQLVENESSTWVEWCVDLACATKDYNLQTKESETGAVGIQKAVLVFGPESGKMLWPELRKSGDWCCVVSLRRSWIWISVGWAWEIIC